MAAFGKKLRIVQRTGSLNPHVRYLFFWCPACDRAHMISIGTPPATWGFNNDPQAPTIKPSVKVDYPGSDAGQQRPSGHRAPPRCCHSVITAGQIRFEPDSTHALAGQTVPLPDFLIDHVIAGEDDPPHA